MNFQLILSALGLFLLLAESMEILGMDKHCLCIKHESRFIPLKSIKKIEISPAGAHCKTFEVIALLHTGHEVCLDPEARWVKRIIKRYQQSETGNN
ncbi:interleukin-8-like [Lepisosteus oculatus]|uniref:interleukin-8-like n=1 Tax=Lepisosteus oculatus TaxID=7918 RepID=UPI0035F517FA